MVFAWDGTGIDARASDDFTAFYQGDALAELGALNGGALSRRTRADHEQIGSFHKIEF